ncbi:hypothetical protein [Helicobacter didelphidarum]|nr:hypothetical protein [Helicobacter didelphidarum]
MKDNLPSAKEKNLARSDISPVVQDLLTIGGGGGNSAKPYNFS